MLEDNYQPNLPSASEDGSRLSLEQQDTVRVLAQVLGETVADRYVDFCKLAFGSHGLRVSVPVAAHVLREIDSIFRGALEEFVNDRSQPDPKEIKRRQAAEYALRSLGYDEDSIARAIMALGPRDSHKATIKKIVVWLGFADNGDLAKDWLSVSGAHRMAHDRKISHAMHVDDEFRRNWAEPFDRVVREIAIALRSRFSALVTRVDILAREKDVSKALADFEKQNMGALSVQRHFFSALEGPAWLPALVSRDLIAEPISGLPDENGNQIFRDWPVGYYLQKIANSEDTGTLGQLSAVVRALKGSNNPYVRQACSKIIAAMPTAYSAPLVDVIIGWLPGNSDYGVISSALDFLKKLAADDARGTCTELAAALFGLTDNDGTTGTAFPEHMYEHHLLNLQPILTHALGMDALRLFVDLLHRTAIIERRIRTDPYQDYTSVILEPLPVDERSSHGVYGALTTAVIQCGFSLVGRDGVDICPVTDVLFERRCHLIERIAMLVLSKKPQAAPERAEALLLEADLLESHNMRHEYAALAMAWFPHMSSIRQDELLSMVDALPGKHIESYRKRLAEYEQRDVTPDDEVRFAQCVIRDATWYWRSVLPENRQQDLMKTVEAWGEPDAWMNRFAAPEVSPMEADDFATASVPEIVNYLETWSPGEGEVQQTKSALGQSLRTAVQVNPLKFSSGAALFAETDSHYLQRFIEGLRSAAQNNAEIDWLQVFQLVAAILPRLSAEKSQTASAEESEPSLHLVMKEAGSLICAGLRHGVEGIPFHCDEALCEIISIFEQIAPTEPDIDDFELKFVEHPYFIASETMFGLVTELNILRIHWLSKQPESPVCDEPRKALALLPEFGQFAARVLAETGDNGRITRAIFGRYLNLLLYFGAEWVKANFDLIFPKDEMLAEAAWYSHLLQDNSPAKSLMAELAPLYRREIAALKGADLSDQRDHRQERLCDYILVLYLTDVIETGLVEAFWDAASSHLLKHGLWFLGHELRRTNLPPEVRVRGEAYWEARLNAAEAASEKDRFRGEMGVIGGWTLDTGIPPTWLLAQLQRVLDAGYAPSDSYLVVQWAAKISGDHIDDVVCLIEALVSNPHLERWALMSQEAEIRTILTAGRVSPLLTTRNRVENIVSILASKGDTSFLDLAQKAN